MPLTDARDNFSRLIHDIETLSDGLYVLTKGGKPAIALINIKYLEEIMGNKELPATGEKQLATSHKVEEPAPKKLEARSQVPVAPIVPKPSFEVPRIPTIPINSNRQPLASSSLAPNQSSSSLAPAPKPFDSAQDNRNAHFPGGNKPEASSPSTPSTELGTGGLPSTQLGVSGVNPLPGASLPSSNYDVKPSVNPTWTGEEPKQVLGTNDSGLDGKPVPSSSPTVLGVNQSSVLSPQAPNPPTPTKPPVNPWPIIPPRQAPPVEKGYEPSATVPPRRDDVRDTSPTTVPPRAPREQGIRDNSSTVPPRQAPPAEPLASSSQAPSQISPPVAPSPKLEANSPSTGLGVNPLPEASFPKMVAPPPPPPPSSLPNIPSSFQTVPVPINGNKEQLAPSPSTGLGVNSQQSVDTSSPAESRKPIADSPAPQAPLPPPPITTAPAPFTGISTPTAPASTPKPADSIAFDQPPKTIPEPGEELPVPSAVSPSTQPGVTDQPAANLPATPAPATPPPSVKDLEI